MRMEHLINLVIISAVTVGVPGPTIFALISASLRTGFRKSMALTVGILAGDVIFIALAAFGVTAAITTSPVLWLVVRAHSAIYLASIGLKAMHRVVRELLIKNAASGNDSALTTLPAEKNRSIRQIFVLHVTNMKAAVFFMALVPSLVPVAAGIQETALAGLEFLAVHACTALGIMSAYAGMARLAARAIKSSVLINTLDMISAAVMIALAFGIVSSFEMPNF
jgi:threonine/homoserine/homoserine lactone efflux protein